MQVRKHTSNMSKVKYMIMILQWNLSFTTILGSQEFGRKWEVVSKQRIKTMENDCLHLRMWPQLRGGPKTKGLQMTVVPCGEGNDLPATITAL